MMRTFNVELGYPALEDARKRVIAEIRNARKQGVRVLKIIHGYGSSGRGGTLCHGLRRSFTLRKREKVIRDFIPGERFSIFEPVVQELLEAVPEVRRDPDLQRANEGVTILWLA
jgi:hypothetical protein